MGDAVYLDDPFEADCDVSNNPNCFCPASFIHKPPFQCFAGNIQHAYKRAIAMKEHSDYAAFLSYMCDEDNNGVDDNANVRTRSDYSSLQQRVLPHCKRPVLGTYDDHDFGWNNGNKRLPDKDQYRKLFLDFMGEDPASPRRTKLDGIYHKYVLGEIPKESVEVILLDERFNRQPLPCYIRKELCDAVLSQANTTDPDAKAKIEASSKYVWCKDFLKTAEDMPVRSPGSCCIADDLVANKWCLQPENKNTDNDFYNKVCNYTHPSFGLNLPGDWRTRLSLPQDTPSPFCELLGTEQRSWLQKQLQMKSGSPLRLIASGSVLISNPLPLPCDAPFSQLPCPCSEDNWDCYRVAQKNLLYMITSNISPNRCSVVLTGDFHFHDIKYVPKGNEQYPVVKPLFQVMSSGLTSSTARPDVNCNEPFRLDPLNLREPQKDCNNLLRGPGFGSLSVDWTNNKLSMQIIQETSSSKISVLNLETCEKINP